MSQKLPSVTLHQQEGVSLAKFSEMTGVSVKSLRRHCVAGRIIGARKHALTKKWWVYPPAKLITGRML